MKTLASGLPVKPVLRVSVLALAVSAVTAQAQAPADDVDIEEVVVTGVRGQPRSVAESPTPIDVFSAAELEQTGRSGVFQALEYLIPSFYLPTRAGGTG